MKRPIEFAHMLLKESVNEGDFLIDATCGNGNDTLFLAQLTGKNGFVHAYDVQEEAIMRSKELTKSQTNIRYILDSHAQISHYLTEDKIKHVDGAIFNLGYLPKSDKSIITKPDSTIQAITSILDVLTKGKRVVIVIYHGHEGGKDEKNAVLDYVKALSQKEFAVLQYGFINQKNNPPFVIGIEKN